MASSLYVKLLEQQFGSTEARSFLKRNFTEVGDALALPCNKLAKIGHEEALPAVHVIFCIDQSGSMRERDVKSLSSPRLTRWEAVFRCAQEFVADQTAATEREKAAGHELGKMTFSLVLWSDTANVVFERLPLNDRRSGEDIKNQLDIAHARHFPKGGTTFAAAFRTVNELVRQDERLGDKVLVMFLSDGKPGDLRSRPPERCEKIQRTYRVHGMTLQSAACELENLRGRFSPNNLDLRFVGIHAEGFRWLRCLADHYDGHFYENRLELEEQALVSVSQSLSHVSSELQNAAYTLPALPAPAHAVPTATTTPVSMPSTAVPNSTAAASTSTGMRSTFLSISQACTAMRATSRRRVERNVTLESGGASSSEESHFADVKRMRVVGEAFKPVAKDQKRVVTLKKNPFAQGGLRNVYRMTEIVTSAEGIIQNSLVAKESRYELPYEERLRFHIETSKCQTRAQELATEFNSRLATIGAKSAMVTFVHTEVYRLRDPSAQGKFRYLAVEPELTGKYTKFNGNEGSVISGELASELEESLPLDLVGLSDVPQAFSHWTWEFTDKQEVVVDIQGVFDRASGKFMYTDPQLHSIEGAYGRADLKMDGMVKFFSTHKCGKSCQLLGLQSECRPSL
eukprot:TRINITY_DN81718_c0_g1_i1.p1 TRINITY_DN81718_c0_g1~~TRINITY_DN81718_c0_g1_i1.p1  ORF type:complete len:627 (+),score=89.74 TRINITY_DN81718_c0_g1_i1:53-1933(+)